MDDYISREAALETIKSLYPSMPLVKLNADKWHEKNKAYMDCETAIEDLPAADVRPVVRGKWIKNGWSINCSECGFDMPYTIRNFCPNCGAKMDLEE